MDRPSSERQYPAVWRVAIAFLLAPAISAVLIAIAIPAFDGRPNWSDRVWSNAVTFGLMIAYPIAIMFGLPAYLTLSRYYAPGPFTCSLAGFVIADVAWGLMNSSASTPPAVFIDWRAIIINNADSLLLIGLWGAITGLVFWAVAAAPVSFPKLTE